MVTPKFDNEYINELFSKANAVKFNLIEDSKTRLEYGRVDLEFNSIHKDDIYVFYEYYKQNVMPIQTIINVEIEKDIVMITLRNLKSNIFIQFFVNNFNKSETKKFIERVSFRSQIEIWFYLTIIGQGMNQNTWNPIFKINNQIL